MNSTDDNQFVAHTYNTSDYIEITFLPIAITVGVALNLWNLSKLKTQLCKSYDNNNRRKSKTRRMTYVFLIVNLTVSDLKILLVYGLGRFGWLISYQWIGGPFLCKLFHFYSLFSFHLEGFTVVLIAMNRLLTVRRNRNNKSLKKKYKYCFISIVSTWVLSALFSSGQWFVWQTYEPEENFVQCTTIWMIEKYEYQLVNKNFTETINNEKMYNLFHLLTVFWIPLTIIVCCYIIIGYKLLLHRLQLKTFKTTFPRVSIRRHCYTSRVFRSAALVVLCYVLCWFPYNVLQVWQFFDPISSPIWTDCLQVLDTLIVLNAVVNPLIYRLTN